MKLGLYSITYLGAWYRGRALTMPELVERAVAFGYDGVEIDGKRPHGNPMDWDARARGEMRELCASKGIEVVGVASNNDFASPVPEHRECQLLMVREQIRLCRDLGGKVVRLFFAWPGITFDAAGLARYDVARTMAAENSRYSSWLERWQLVRSCLREAARMADDAGVTLALQNHTPLLRTYRDMLAMIREVDSPALRASLDCPLLERQDDEYVRRAVHDTGHLQALSHFGGEYQRAADGRLHQQGYEPWESGGRVVNYSAFVHALKEVGYDGYLSFEFCHQALNGQHEVQGLEYVDEQARLAAAYMREILVGEGVYTGRGAALARS